MQHLQGKERHLWQHLHGKEKQFLQHLQQGLRHIGQHLQGNEQHLGQQMQLTQLHIGQQIGWHTHTTFGHNEISQFPQQQDIYLFFKEMNNIYFVYE